MMMMNMIIKKIKGTVIKDRKINEIMLDMISSLTRDRVAIRVTTESRMNRSTLGKNIKTTTVTVGTTKEAMPDNDKNKTLKAWMKTNTVTKKTIIQINNSSNKPNMRTKISFEDLLVPANGKNQSKEKVMSVKISNTLRMVRVLRLKKGTSTVLRMAIQDIMMTKMSKWMLTFLHREQKVKRKIPNWA